MKKYRLIKELPFENSPKIGYISKPTHPKEPLHYWNHNWFKPEEYPEYWEELTEKNYEILSFINSFKYFDKDFTIAVKKSDNMFYFGSISYTEKELGEKGWEIYSVKRKSDGEVFTINDKVENKREPTSCGLIKKIKLSDEKIKIYFFLDFDYLEDVKKSEKPLFTTADGFDISEGDKFYCVYIPFYEIGIRIGGDGLGVKEERVRKRCFLKEKNAEEYVVMNKPCLSIKEIAPIIGRCNETTYVDLDCLTEKLKNIVKSKL